VSRGGSFFVIGVSWLCSVAVFYDIYGNLLVLDVVLDELWFDFFDVVVVGGDVVVGLMLF